MKVLVTGGAGYIGSHVLVSLKARGYEVVVVDDLLRGQEEKIFYGRLEKFNLDDKSRLDTLMSAENFDAIIHLAAFIDVEESIRNPTRYLCNNTANTILLLELALKHDIKNFVFSSTAAVYGYREISESVVDENAHVSPVSPYGISKFLSEEAIRAVEQYSENFNFMILRYFNVAGFDVQNLSGYYNVEMSNLVAKASKAAIGEEVSLKVYGGDYQTADGSCERDFIHVSDLADIHALALDDMYTNNRSAVYNCGYNLRTSVLQVIEAFKDAGYPVLYEVADRRKGDPVALIADASKMMKDFCWSPKYSLKDMICSMVAWEKSKILK